MARSSFAVAIQDVLDLFERRGIGENDPAYRTFQNLIAAGPTAKQMRLIAKLTAELLAIMDEGASARAAKAMKNAALKAIKKL
ncbi:MAG: hypothetical protein HY290_11445 [Planctomycetia bacterium]|nr:hypothetical protein [Planctomycetia bacterium]